MQELLRPKIRWLASRRRLCRRGGFRLHNFTTNSKEVIETIKNIDLDKQTLPLASVLGTKCSESSDGSCVQQDALLEDLNWNLLEEIPARNTKKKERSLGPKEKNTALYKMVLRKRQRAQDLKMHHFSVPTMKKLIAVSLYTENIV